MSLVTTRSRYGLRLLVELAEQGVARATDLAGIARRQGIPESYLAKLALALKAAGLIRSERGARGGYALARAPEDIDLFTVVEVLEGRSSLLECSSDPSSCPRSGECKTLPVWTGLDQVVREYLSAITVASLAGSFTDYSI